MLCERDDAALWDRGVAQLKTEFSALSALRRDELIAVLKDMAQLKEEILLLTDGADGSAICAACDGACCRVGKYHPAPLDLLDCIMAGELPVPPDFTRSDCPFLGDAGCRVIPSRRSFTCVIFICEFIAERLPEGEANRLVRLEEQLRLLRRWTAEHFGPRLTESFFLAMERNEQECVSFLIARSMEVVINGD